MDSGDVAMMSLFYVLGYFHGYRYYRCKMQGVPYYDLESEEDLIEALPPEVAALRLGADPEPAAEKIKALMLASKGKNTRAE